MAITRDVNVGLLNECFELIPFHGLCKPHSEDVLKPTKEELEELNENVNNLSTNEIQSMFYSSFFLFG